MPKKEPEAQAKRPVGRPKGITAKVLGRTQTLRELAQVYAPEALNVLARIAMDEDAPAAARVTAADKLLDRGYGRAAQADPAAGDTADREVRSVAVEKLKGLSDAALEEIARAEARANA